MTDDRPQAEVGGKRTQGLGEGELDDRLARLEKSLADRRGIRDAKSRQATSDATGYAQAFRLSAEFVAGIGVGVALGWGFDRWLGTSPWGLIVFLLLGFAAGVVNVLRAAGLAPEPGSVVGRKSKGDAERDTRSGEKR